MLGERERESEVCDVLVKVVLRVFFDKQKPANPPYLDISFICIFFLKKELFMSPNKSIF